MSGKSIAKFRALTAWQWIDFVTFGVMLGLALHNSVRYLVIQGRWNNIYLVAFYTLTILVAIIRMYYFFCEFKLFRTEEANNIWFKQASALNSVTFSLTSLLCAFQVA